MLERAVDCQGLYHALEKHMKSKGISSWRALAQEIGVSPSTFTRLKKGENPDVDTFAALVAWLGLKTDAFIRTPERKTQADDIPVAVYSLLRASKKINPDQAKALNEMFSAAYKMLTEKKS